MRNVQSVQTGRLSFHLSFNFTTPYLSQSKQFWTTNISGLCYGDFVCVYDQYYALGIVAQQKGTNVKSFQTGRLSFHLLFNFTKPLLSGPKQFWITNWLDECLGDFVCVYD